MTDDALPGGEPAPTPTPEPVAEAVSEPASAEPTPTPLPDPLSEEVPEPAPTEPVAPPAEAAPAATEEVLEPSEADTPEQVPAATAEPVVEVTSQSQLSPSIPDPAPPRDTSSSHTVPQPTVPGASGRNKSAATRARKREELLEKIVAHTRTKEWITNDTVEKLLHVSNATAHRYLTMLVVRGKLWREGKGRGVKYRVV